MLAHALVFLAHADLQPAADGLDDGLGGDAMLFVVGVLDGTAALGLHDGAFHAGGHFIGVHQHYAVGIAGCAANGLDKACLTAKEALFVGIQDGNQRNFRQVETLTQQIDAHNDINGAHAQVFDNFHALKGVDLVVHVLGLDAVIF